MPKKSGYLGRGVDQETAEMQNKHNHFTLGFLIFVVGGLGLPFRKMSSIKLNSFGRLHYIDER